MELLDPSLPQSKIRLIRRIPELVTTPPNGLAPESNRFDLPQQDEMTLEQLRKIFDDFSDSSAGEPGTGVFSKIQCALCMAPVVEYDDGLRRCTKCGRVMRTLEDKDHNDQLYPNREPAFDDPKSQQLQPRNDRTLGDGANVASDAPEGDMRQYPRMTGPEFGA